MILLGTHNSLSYLPCQWYLRLFAWVGRCQSLTLEKQYGKGVRYFDIRVKYVNGKALSGHGLLTYDIDVDEVLDAINRFDENCIVRLFLENSKRNPTKDFERFAKDIKDWKERFWRTRFIEGGCRYAYKKFIEEEDDDISIRECYWKKEYTLLPYPKGYAKKQNSISHSEDNDKKFSIYDFIEF